MRAARYAQAAWVSAQVGLICTLLTGPAGSAAHSDERARADPHVRASEVQTDWTRVAQEPPGLVSQAPTFVGTASELVVLSVTVTDRRGTLVPDLSQERFVVLDEGRVQPVALFSNEDTPVTVGLVLDSSRSMAPRLGEVIAAALAFARSSNPNDVLFALAFNDTVQELGPGMLAASDLAGLESALSGLIAQGRTALYDGLDAALSRAEQASGPRKALILVSDGGDNASHAALTDVLMRARRSNVSIFTVGLVAEGDRDANPRLLKTLARTTGGERFMPESPGRLMAACLRIAREIRSGYTLGYEPPARDGAFHHVRVELRPADRRLIVRTREGYLAAMPATSGRTGRR